MITWFPTPSQPALIWVPSHKDDNENIDISTLSSGVQLNIYADKLGTHGLLCLNPKPFVPLDPDVKAQLSYIDGTITKQLKPTLWEHIQRPLRQTYYHDNFEWTNSAFTNVDCTIFAPVYRRHSAKSPKWIHQYSARILPAGDRL